MAQNLGWLDDALFRTLMALFSFANPQGVAYPSQTTLGKACGCHPGTISRRLARLVELGFIEQLRRGHSGAGLAGTYRIRPVDQWPTGPTTREPEPPAS